MDSGSHWPTSESLPSRKQLGAVTETFLKSIGLRIGLDDLKIPEAEWKNPAQQSLVLPDYKNHPRVADQDEIHAILRQSFKSGASEGSK